MAYNYPPGGQGGYPPQQGYPPAGGYPPQQPGYGAQPGGYPPQQPGAYPPQAGGYPPPQAGGYPPQQSGGYPPQAGGYPPQAGGYPPQQGGGYPPQPGYGQQRPPAPGGIGFENVGGAAPHAPAPQPPAQSYGAAPGYGAAPAAAGGYPAYPGGAPPPAQYQPPNSGQMAAAGYPPQQGGGAYPPASGAPPHGAHPPPHGGVAGHPQHSQQHYGAAPAAAAAASYGTAQLTKDLSKMNVVKYQGTLKPYPHFNAEDDAKVLRKAMKGLGTDEKAIISVLGHRSSEQRQQLLVSYKQAFGRDLVKDLKSELSGDFEDLVVAMMMKSRQYDCYCLKKAMSGAGTDEKDIIEILATRSNAEIKEINELYKTLYKKKLESELMSETSGHFRKLLVSLNNGARDESGRVDQSQAEKDAQALYKAGEKKWGTDEATFNLVMASRNFNQLRATFDAYQRIASKDITKSLKSEMSGDVLDGMLALVQLAKDAPTYFAKRLKESMQGAGTSDHDLIRLVVTRAEIDMVQIKERFHSANHKSLENWISSDTSGDYKKLLIAIVT